MGEHLVSLKTYTRRFSTCVSKIQIGYFGLMQFVLTKAVKKNKDIKFSKWGVYTLRLAKLFSS